MNRKLIRKIAGESVMRRVDAVRHELRYGPPAAWGRWKTARERNAKRKLLLAWFNEMRAHPPDILMGANVGTNNGVRFHMEGIRSHSSLRVEFFPPDEIMGRVSYHDLHTTLNDEVTAFDPRGIRVIHSHVYPYFVRWCEQHRDSGAIWVHTYHSPYFPAAPGAQLEPWQHEINDTLVKHARNAHVRISVSRWQQKYLRDNHSIETIYVPNGVDVGLCERADVRRFGERAGRRGFVLYVGRNEPVKNPLDFVRAAERMPDTVFAAAGPGLDSESLVRLSGRELPHNVVTLGELSRLEAQDAIAASSAVVVTSLWEGLPTLVLEAMFHGKPVVVPDNAGCLEATDGGRFGLVYGQGNVDELVERVRQTRSRGVSVEAKERILDEYDWRVIAPKLDRIYSQSS